MGITTPGDLTIGGVGYYLGSAGASSAPVWYCSLGVGPLYSSSAGTVTAAVQAPRRRRRDVLVTASGLLLLGALAAAAFGRGAYFSTIQWVVAVLVAAAFFAALGAWSFSGAELRDGVLASGVLLAAWALLRAAVAGSTTASLGWMLFSAGTAAVVFVSRRLGTSSRETLLGGVFSVGIAVATAGWLGVVLHQRPWGLPSQGLWRAASTLTYPNATAALLVPLALVALSRLAATPESASRSLLAAVLLAGAGATLSRAGAAAFVAGLVVLCYLQGVRVVLRVIPAPVAGAVIVLLGLVPSVQATGSARLLTASMALMAGLAIAVLLRRVPVRTVGLLAAGAVLGSLLIMFFLAPGTNDAVRALNAHRLNLTSPDRSGETTAVLHVIDQHPLAGAAPGHAILRWTGTDGGLRIDRYAHDEYLQVLADLGAIGLALLVMFLAAIGRLLRRGRTDPRRRALWAGAVAGAVAFAIHSGVDFLWHVPAVPLTVAVLVGLAVPSTIDSAAQPAPAAQGEDAQ